MPPRDGDLLMLRRSTAIAAEVQPGDLFWALRGPSDDGMHHGKRPLARRCGAVISDGRLSLGQGSYGQRRQWLGDALWQAAAHAAPVTPAR